MKRLDRGVTRQNYCAALTIFASLTLTFHSLPSFVMDFSGYISQLEKKSDLEPAQMERAISDMMDGTVSEDDMCRFLMLLKEKGESVGELVGAAKAMRSKMTLIRSDRENLVDTCGTGGDGSGTFNISTAAALVAASAGIPVAKHGNRAISSKSGSADALRELGVNVDASRETVERCLKEIGLCFCFAPLFHSSVKNVGAARKKLGVPTVFNMLGPLCNPARASFQLVGVGKSWQRPLIASALQGLGIQKALVVHGKDGLCEISNADETEVSIVTPQGIEETIWTPETFGLTRTTREPLLADSPSKSAELIQAVLQNNPGAATDIVVLNSSATLWLTDSGRSLEECASLAKEQIASGRAEKMLRQLVDLSVNEP